MPARDDRVMAVLEGLDAAQSTLTRLIKKMEDPKYELDRPGIRSQTGIVRIWLDDAVRELK